MGVVKKGGQKEPVEGTGNIKREEGGGKEEVEVSEIQKTEWGKGS